jgi:hypothetical protein
VATLMVVCVFYNAGSNTCKRRPKSLTAHAVMTSDPLNMAIQYFIIINAIHIHSHPVALRYTFSVLANLTDPFMSFVSFNRRGRAASNGSLTNYRFGRIL